MQEYISMPQRHLNDFNKKFMQEFFNDSCIKIKDDDEIYFICDDDEKIQKGSIAFLMGGYGYTDMLFLGINYLKISKMINMKCL